MWILALCLNAQTTIGSRQMSVGESIRYSTQISFRGNGVSGITILKLRDDGILVGSLVNEFGIKAMDFTYSPAKGKVKLLNVISFMNKWYIRKVLQQDLSFMLGNSQSVEKKRRALTVESDGGLVLANRNYNINYYLIPID